MMRKSLLSIILTFLFISLIQAGNPVRASPPLTKDRLFEKAIACIKVFEGWHTVRNHPYIGYGHKLLPGENLTAHLTKAQADSLLRADLERRYVTFRRFGKDALLLAVLSYNVGEYRLLGSGKIPKSGLIRKLEKGDRNIYKEYVSFRRYHGKVIRSLERRREVEFELLYIP